MKKSWTLVILAVLAASGWGQSTEEFLRKAQAASTPAVGGAQAVPGAQAQPAGTQTQKRTKRMADIFAEAVALKAAGKEVLLALDIDNTMLTAPRNFGSEPWIDEEAEVLKPLDKPETKELYNRRWQQLKETFWAITMATHKMLPVEDDLASGIKELQGKDVKVIALTSRNPGVIADTTLGQLKEAGIDFSRSSFGADIKGLKVDGLSHPTSYLSGVAMSDGQDKSKLLAALLGRANYHPSVIIYVDNKQKEIDRISASLKGSPISLVAFLYQRMDDAAQAYKQGGKAVARAQLKAFKETGRMLSNEEAARLPPVSVEEANTLIYGTPDPLRPDSQK